MGIFLTFAYLFFIGSVFGWVLELLYRNLTQNTANGLTPVNSNNRKKSKAEYMGIYKVIFGTKEKAVRIVYGFFLKESSFLVRYR